MPQMAPMNWMILFFLFIMIFIISINKIFYLSSNEYNFSKTNMTSLSLNLNMWKW